VPDRSQGFPQERQRFVDCVPNDEEPLETGEDGRAALEVIRARYGSAGTGRKVLLPFSPPEGKRAVELWLGGQGQPSRDGTR